MDTIHASETRSRPRFLSRPFVPSQHHVGVLARALPPVLKYYSVIQRQPGVADAMIKAQKWIEKISQPPVDKCFQGTGCQF